MVSTSRFQYFSSAVRNNWKGAFQTVSLFRQSKVLLNKRFEGLYIFRMLMYLSAKPRALNVFFNQAISPINSQRAVQISFQQKKWVKQKLKKVSVLHSWCVRCQTKMLELGMGILLLLRDTSFKKASVKATITFTVFLHIKVSFIQMQEVDPECFFRLFGARGVQLLHTTDQLAERRPLLVFFLFLFLLLMFVHESQPGLFCMEFVCSVNACVLYK